MECRLAAILAADVVGYSRLLGEGETGTLSTLNATRNLAAGVTSAAEFETREQARLATLSARHTRTLSQSNTPKGP
jgi:hypothetical protein